MKKQQLAKRSYKHKRLHVHATRLAFLTAVFGVAFFLLPRLNTLTWVELKTTPDQKFAMAETVVGNDEDLQYVPTRLDPPFSIKALYMSSWVAGTQSMRDHVLKLVEDTEANAVVVDIKDYSGKISFRVRDPALKEMGADENRIPNIREFINYLHGKGIYVIGRIAVFQDPFFAKIHPELTVLDKRTGKSWKDFKGNTWLDPGARLVWDYAVSIGKESWDNGFDELNYDFIRFPSDGEISQTMFRFYDEDKMDKATQMREFFKYLRDGFKGTNAVLSADLFGMTTTYTDDLRIGQILEYAAPYFDYIAPMVYPSHYVKGFMGFKNPAGKPYEVVKYSMDRAVERLVAASSTPSKLRPWLQDFDIGTVYTAEMIRKEKQAVYDAGLTSWMMWDPSNKYTRGALD